MTALDTPQKMLFVDSLKDIMTARRRWLEASQQQLLLSVKDTPLSHTHTQAYKHFEPENVPITERTIPLAAAEEQN